MLLILLSYIEVALTWEYLNFYLIIFLASIIASIGKFYRIGNIEERAFLNGHPIHRLFIIAFHIIFILSIICLIVISFLKLKWYYVLLSIILIPMITTFIAVPRFSNIYEMEHSLFYRATALFYLILGPYIKLILSIGISLYLYYVLKT